MIKATILFYLVGLCYLYGSYINRLPFHLAYPDIAYYTWEKLVGVGVLFCLRWRKLSKSEKVFVLWAFIVSCVRAVWQLIAYFVSLKYKIGIEPGDDWRVATCFLAAIVAIGVIVFRGSKWIPHFLDWHLKQIRA